MTMTAPGRVIPRDQHRKNLAAIFAICNRFSLTRGDRMELAEVLLDRNVNSYSDLSTHEVGRIRDALEGAALVCLFQIERKRGERR